MLELLFLILLFLVLVLSMLISFVLVVLIFDKPLTFKELINELKKIYDK
jgi:hypothetical protein